MNESLDALVLGLISAAAVAYLGFKVQQDRERLRRIVGIIDAQHSFDMGYLLSLVDNGQLAPYTPSASPTPV